MAVSYTGKETPWSQEKAKAEWEKISGQKANPVDYNSSFNNNKSSSSSSSSNKSSSSSSNKTSSSTKSTPTTSETFITNASQGSPQWGKDASGNYTGRSFNPETGYYSEIGETVYKPSNSSNGTEFENLNSEFNNKYNQQIQAIARYNGVDMSTATAMFTSNLDNNNGNYKGGGVANNWDEMVSDYKNLKQSATKDTLSRDFYDVNGNKMSGADLLSRPESVYGEGGTGVGGGVGQGGLGMAGGGVMQGGQPQYDAQGNPILDFYKQASDDFLNSQLANLQAQVQQQLTELEQAYSTAISEGQISVRDAQRDFEAQKAEIENKAYQQAEATKGYGSQMGIANSQQMIGLQQNDNSRVNSLNNANASDRDNRVADIKDRINALTLNKNLATTNAQNQYQIGVQGATAQASQMYNQSAGGFMEKNYMADKQFGQELQLAELGQKYKLEGMSQQQVYDLDKMDKQFTQQAERDAQLLINEFKVMDYGEKIDLNKMMVSAGIQSRQASQASINRANERSAELNSQKSAMEEAMDFEIEKLGITASDISKAGGSKARAIDIKQGNNAKQLEKEAFDMKIYGSIQQGIVETKMNTYYGEGVVQKPADLKDKKDYTKGQPLGKWDPVGSALNTITGYNKKNTEYEKQMESYNRWLSDKNAFDKQYGLK